MTFAVSMSARIAAGAAMTGLLALAGCGGGNPLSNPPDVSNPPGAGGQTLSYVYYQKCINPIFLAQLQININGVLSVNTCAAGGCHDTVSGTGGAFRLVGGAQPVDVATSTPDAIRASDMYKNFYSTQGEVVFGSLTQSRILAKPRLLNVLHGGGLIFETDQDPNVRLLQYWINHPVPQGQDEFSASANSMFTPADPATGACNTQ